MPRMQLFASLAPARNLRRSTLRFARLERLESRSMLAAVLADDAATLVVTSFLPTTSGFVATFNQQVDVDEINIYDSEAAGLGESDVILWGDSRGPVTGSLVIAPDRQQITFVKTGGPLADDGYSVTLRSADDGFKSLAGDLLDGDRDGISAGDFSASFAAQSASTAAVVVSAPDFVRGPGQQVNFPGDSTAGIPISLSVANAVARVDVEVGFDPTLLSISAAELPVAAPAGSSISWTLTAPGRGLLQFASPVPLFGADQVFARLQARVPQSASSSYGQQAVLDLSSVSVRDFRDLEIPAVGDVGFHVAKYIADVTANGRVNGSDASQVARFAAFLDTGFASLPRTDPNLLGDISGNGRVNAADATWAALIGALHPVPGVPPIPLGAAAARGGPVRMAPQSGQFDAGNAAASESSCDLVCGAAGSSDRVPRPPRDNAAAAAERHLAQPLGKATPEAIDELFGELNWVPSLLS